ncbi:Bug family tripartite tricarboxylate transporter substrate binding protein [Pigmentiphaga sp.]|uniref:Bug family tripartite tricarboxylate transporter substrate binding protein n=1 Tax=Pigmentiphaga sp. TaxID=1977564 RepID=UPI0039B9BE2B
MGRLILTCALAGLALGGAQAAAAAAAYPSKPVTVVVAYPPGSDTDGIARLFAEKLSARFKQPVIVENRAGATGTVGNIYVSRQAPDGYTLLFTPAPFSTAPVALNLPASSSYDVVNGFTPIIQTSWQPLVLVANARTGFKTVKDMIDAAKAGKQIAYGAPGVGSPMHVAAELLNEEAGVKTQLVPYKGVAPAVTDVVAGHVQTAWVTLGSVAQYVKAGKLNQLAITDPERAAIAPDVPTLREQGYKNVSVTASWSGFMAPKGTPAEVVELINRHMNQVLKEKDVVEKLAVYGAYPAGGTPEDLAKANLREYEVVGGAIRKLGITAQ